MDDDPALLSALFVDHWIWKLSDSGLKTIVSLGYPLYNCHNLDVVMLLLSLMTSYTSGLEVASTLADPSSSSDNDGVGTFSSKASRDRAEINIL